MSTREFRSVFSDTSLSKDRLCQVHTECWFDGRSLLFEGVYMSRNEERHDWPDWDGTRTEVHSCMSRSQAVRRSVQMHDQFARERFMAHASKLAEATEREPQS